MPSVCVCACVRARVRVCVCVCHRLLKGITNLKFIVVIGIVCIFLLLLPVAIAACLLLHNVSKILLSLKILF